MHLITFDVSKNPPDEQIRAKIPYSTWSIQETTLDRVNDREKNIYRWMYNLSIQI